MENGMAFVVVCAAAAVFCIVLICAAMWVHMRRKYVAFATQVCDSIDMILKGKGTSVFELEEETLLSKIQMRLKRLSEITEAAARESEDQKKQVQSIVSDISHQLKTPIANITMYCDTALRPGLSEEMHKQCLETMEKQVKRLDSLIQSLVQMSRLENNIIELHVEENDIKDTLFEVVENARIKALKKNISIELDCPKGLILRYDEKWTAEAIFNLVDNSVKYTNVGGKVLIYVEPMEMYTRITVKDDGVGIAPEHINDVCKRFFREEKANHVEGVGIGLYLTREIIMKQGGYLKIQSEEGKGTRVQVFLLRAV
ncbi:MULTISPECIES: sensor histidine kinase [Faecalicatena]|nr:MULTISPECIES: HAMP domain-containing sensor histidine kinase [Faecalicatena]MCI6467566.1 HAMP domain-containing histidine kinase [Faecalicatena sp.]MDY5619743.1 HAMP domain-containing sensor histidine kinase [Lachnospiraceae bacterium]